MSPLFGVLASFGFLHAPQPDAAMGEAAGEFRPAPILSRPRIQELVARLETNIRAEVLSSLRPSHAPSATTIEHELERLVRAVSKLTPDVPPTSRALLTIRGTVDQLLVRLMAAADDGMLEAPRFENVLAHVQALQRALAGRA